MLYQYFNLLQESDILSSRVQY